MNKSEALLRELFDEIAAATQALVRGDITPEDLPTATEIARKLNVKLDQVKKKLRILRQSGVVKPVSYAPKRYRINPQVMQELSTDDPLYTLLNVDLHEEICWL